MGVKKGVVRRYMESYRCKEHMGIQQIRIMSVVYIHMYTYIHT